MRRQRMKQVVLLLILLALPGFLYYLLQEKGRNRYKPLPFFGEKKLSGTYHSKRGKKIPDTTFYSVRLDSTVFKPVLGKVVAFGLAGKNSPAVALDVIDDIFKRNQSVATVRIIVPDGIAGNAGPVTTALQREREAYGAGYMLRADTAFINKTAVSGLLLDLAWRKEGGNIAPSYTNKLVLIDTEGHIRGYYEAANQEEADRLRDEIKLLLAEKGRNVVHRDNL